MHSDPELLALLALGEHVGTEDDRLHVQTCPACAADLAELSRVVTLGRTVDATATLSTPSEGVWARIRAELDLGTEAAATTSGSVDALTARARLVPVESRFSRASGQAELATDARGRRVLQVTLDADLPTSGVRQAWLIHRDDPSLRQTLGILDGTHGLWTVDHSIDLELFAILDVSQQGTGQTEHSGQTIVRGELVLAG